MKTRNATSTARRTLLRRGRDLLKPAGRRKADDIMETLEPQQREELGAIHKALERIERGIFGACESCRNRIEEERLLATPWKADCLNCEQSVTAQDEGPTAAFSERLRSL